MASKASNNTKRSTTRFKKQEKPIEKLFVTNFHPAPWEDKCVSAYKSLDLLFSDGIRPNEPIHVYELVGVITPEFILETKDEKQS